MSRASSPVDVDSLDQGQREELFRASVDALAKDLAEKSIEDAFSELEQEGVIEKTDLALPIPLDSDPGHEIETNEIDVLEEKEKDVKLGSIDPEQEKNEDAEDNSTWPDKNVSLKKTETKIETNKSHNRVYL